MVMFEHFFKFSGLLWLKTLIVSPARNLVFSVFTESKQFFPESVGKYLVSFYILYVVHQIGGDYEKLICSNFSFLKKVN